MTELSSPSVTLLRPPRWQAFAEVLAIVVLFFLLGSGAAPEINEAHYLSKAKHFWNPQWCPNDAFLNTADAHYVFYLTGGLITRWTSLPVSAWLGRLAVWSLLAVAWRHLSWAIVPRWGMALLSAGLWVGLVNRCHISGEWIIGGIEAKGMAYALVLAGLAEICRSRWSRAWIFLGSAAAFHVLVGGWTVVTAFWSWIWQPRLDRPRWGSMLPSLLVGGILSLPGLLPALSLTWRSDATMAARACQIYVFERLPHHLLLSAFPRMFVVRHLLLLALFLALAWSLRSSRPYRRLAGCVGGAALLGIVGGLIELTGNCPLLRLYWFRATDVMVPIGVALGVILWIDRLIAQRPRTASWLLGTCLLLIGSHVVSVVAEAHQDPIPAADWQGHIASPQQLRDWQAVCGWIQDHVPVDACLLTPTDHQTFKWYAGRSEVVTWKDIPQDADGIVQWQTRRNDVQQLAKLAQFGSQESALQRLHELAQQYGFSYWLVRSNRPWPTTGLPLRYRNPSYAVYQLPCER